jgi:ribosomal protein S21
MHYRLSLKGSEKWIKQIVVVRKESIDKALKRFKNLVRNKLPKDYRKIRRKKA